MYRGPAATPSQVDLNSRGDRTLVKTNVARRGCLATPMGRCDMNATARIAPAGPQYMRALERANEVRLARAELKRRVAFGEIDVAKVIVNCPWETHTMAVFDLLMSQRRWGQTRCRKMLAQLPVSDKKTVGSMTDRQRYALAAMLTSVDRLHARSATPWATD
jgi:hypothetical protein